MIVDLQNLSCEERLLTGLCRLSFSESEKEEVLDLIKKVTDWDRFVWLANEHGVIALAGYNLRVIGAGHRATGAEEEGNGVTALRRYGITSDKMTVVPERIMKVLDNGLMQSVVRNAWLAERWREVNRILGDAGIKHILLKGMALEHTIYGSRGLRQMNDNDILLKREDCMRAWNLLQQNGFTIETVKSSLHRRILPDIGKHLPTLYKDGYAVEIHHHLYNISDSEKVPDFFEDAEEILVGDTKALKLSRKNQLKHLISHFETHAAEGICQLRMYIDIIMLDENSSLEMPEHFIKNPQQTMTMKHKRAAYRATLKSVPKRLRFRFIVGDIFPSVEWMRKRHNCNSFKALIYYPRRIGKLGWVV